MDIHWLFKQLNTSPLISGKEKSELFILENRVYTVEDFQQYLLSKYYLEERMPFARSVLVKKYFEDQKLSYSETLFKSTYDNLQKDYFKILKVSSDAELKNWLEESHLNLDIFHDFLTQQAKDQSLFFAVAEHLRNQDVVLKEVFQEEHQKNFLKKEPLESYQLELNEFRLEKRKIAKIIYPQEKFEKELETFVTEKMAFLTQLKKDISEGKLTFNQAVEIYSEDDYLTLRKGGEFGIADPKMRGEEFYQEIQKLKVGEMLSPFQTSKGLFLVEVSEIIPQEIITTRQLLFAPNTGTPENPISKEEATKKMKEDAQLAWKEIQSAPNPEEAFKALIQKYNKEEDSLYGPISKSRLFKSYQKSVESVPLKQIAEPFETSLGIYILQPLEVTEGRKVRQVMISTNYNYRFNKFAKEGVIPAIETKTKEIIAYAMQHSLEETKTNYADWLEVRQIFFQKGNSSMSEKLEQEFFSGLKIGDFFSPYWGVGDSYYAYQIHSIRKVVFEEVKSEILDFLSQPSTDPRKYTDPILAKMYPFTLNYYVPAQNVLLGKSTK